jgi:hypothetical protein
VGEQRAEGLAVRPVYVTEQGVLQQEPCEGVFVPDVLDT